MAKRPSQTGGKRVRHRPPGVRGALSRTAPRPAELSPGLRHRFVHPPALRGARPPGVMPLHRLQRNGLGLTTAPGDCRPSCARADGCVSLVEVPAETRRAAERGVWPEAGRRVDVPGEGVPAVPDHRHEDGTMSTAIAFPNNTASTFLTHIFGTGLVDERYVVERFRAHANGDIRTLPGEALAAGRGRRKAKRVTATLKAVKELRPARTEIIICTGSRTRGGMQVWGDIATSMFHDRRCKG